MAHRSRGVKVKVQAQTREAFASTPSSLRLPLMMYHTAEGQKKDTRVWLFTEGHGVAGLPY